MAVPDGAAVAIGPATMTIRRGLLDSLLPDEPVGEGDESLRVIVADPAMKQVHRVIAMVAQGSISVLIVGETGVGKEVVGSTLHHRSPRAGGPFVFINCAALPEALLESELFGHERGAFTGAAGAKEGLLQTGSGGTAFLDEIAEMPLGGPGEAPSRARAGARSCAVDATTPQSIDVRFVAATNPQPEEAIAQD